MKNKKANPKSKKIPFKVPTSLNAAMFMIGAMQARIWELEKEIQRLDPDRTNYAKGC